MNELVNTSEKTMTTKEIAQALNVDVRTVQLTANRILDPTTVQRRVINGGKSMVFNEEQVTLIKQEIQKHHNLASRQIDKMMTTKEVAEALGTSSKVILENARKCLLNKRFVKGKPTFWTQEEVTVLLECLKGNKPSQYAFTETVKAVSTDLTPALKLKKALELAQEAYEEELARLKAENQKVTVERNTLQIELDESKEWTTLQKYFNSKGWETDRNKLAQLSKTLGNLGYERKKIYSVEYECGLWSYRIKDLDEYFLEPEF